MLPCWIGQSKVHANEFLSRAYYHYYIILCIIIFCITFIVICTIQSNNIILTFDNVYRYACIYISINTLSCLYMYL